MARSVAPPPGARSPLSFVGNLIARQRLEKRKTAAMVCLHDFALNNFASVPARLALEDACDFASSHHKKVFFLGLLTFIDLY
jgi:hypothetical protein